MTADELRTKFHGTFGHGAEVHASAPGRVNIIGEHTDYSDGWVLPFAIDFRTDVLIGRRTDSDVVVVSAQRPGQVERYNSANLVPANTWSDYVAGVVFALGISTGVSVLVDGNVPNGAGLSSSAALECATALALNELFQLGLNRTELALAAQKAENQFVGMPCGIMDQSVSLLAANQHALLLDTRTMQTTQIPFDLDSRGLALLVIDTRAHHALVDGGYATRRASIERVAAALGVKALRDTSLDVLESRRGEFEEDDFRRARHVVTENNRVHEAVAALEQDDYSTLGTLINLSHDSLRDDLTVSCPESDVAAAAAQAAGALGARMIGGGFGGSVIALVAKSQLVAVRQSVQDAFAASGFESPRFFVATPAPGATSEFL